MSTVHPDEAGRQVQPSLVFAGGRVFGTDAEAVAVGGGRIVAVGDTADVIDIAGAGAEHIDLSGRILVPGFQDAHVHPPMGGLMRLRCNLEPADDLQTALGIIRDHVAESDAPWILGGGWRYSWFEGGNPDAALLDDITDRPVALGVADGHSMWVNRTALALAGIDETTPDPPGGVIVRRGDRTPQGTLHEAAMDLLDGVVPDDRPEDIRAAVLESQSYLLSLGITAWQDAWVTPQTDAVYRELAASGELVCRVRGAQWWDRDRGIDQLDEILDRAEQPVGGYVPRTVKLMLDGVCENLTASMLHPYRSADGEPTDNRGVDFIDPDQLPEIVAAIDRAGLQCHFHAVGDRAVRTALDAVEHARRENGMLDTRPHLAHLQLIDPVDVGRFAELDATATIQPLWACNEPAMTELTIPLLPTDRVQLQYPFRSLRDAGARLAIGSDWMVSTPDVLAQLEVATRRVPVDRPDAEPFLPEQRLSPGEALHAVTAGSAYVNFLDADSGAIEVGRRADLVVLDADPEAVEQISEVTVDMTVVGGRITHHT